MCNVPSIGLVGRYCALCKFPVYSNDPEVWRQNRQLVNIIDSPPIPLKAANFPSISGCSSAATPSNLILTEFHYMAQTPVIESKVFRSQQNFTLQMKLKLTTTDKTRNTNINILFDGAKYHFINRTSKPLESIVIFRKNTHTAPPMSTCH